jgi:hypothetical protein
MSCTFICGSPPGDCTRTSAAPLIRDRTPVIFFASVARELRECLSEFALDLFHVAMVLRFERDIELAFVRSESVIT